jgi:L-threonine kinase
MGFMSARITVAIPGTCGELVQGWTPDWDEAVLVSCPIARYSQVRVELCPGPDILAQGPSNDYSKLEQAARLVLSYLGQPNLGARVAVNSQLLPGRGMASSTADVVGVMIGLALTLEPSIPAGELARLACQVEPSDSTMFADLTALAYRDSARFQQLGPVPALPLLMLDTGQAVDTLTFNARLNLRAVRQLAPTTKTALEMLKQGLASNDAAAIGAAATLSALSYQRVNYNPLVDRAMRWVDETGAVGLIRAHSGSVLGLLYPANTNLNGPEQWLASRFEGTICQTQLTRGSYLLVDEPCPHMMEVNAWL